MLKAAGKDTLRITAKGKPIKAKTAGQKSYTDTIGKEQHRRFRNWSCGNRKDLFGCGHGCDRFKTRAGFKAGADQTRQSKREKSWGIFRGILQSKIDPYLRPLYDALFEMMGPESYQKNMEKGIIEIAPLAYMRGRTLDDSFIILDEAQNTTPEQMKMFLTRLGVNSKAVVTGDITQTDLPKGQKSGLVEAVKVLPDVEDIAVFRLTEQDVVRHQLVQRIILAYDNYARKKEPWKSKNTTP